MLLQPLGEGSDEEFFLCLLSGSDAELDSGTFIIRVGFIFSTVGLKVLT